jgi:hypothetical protein
MAQRIPAGTRPDVLQLQPIWRCRAHAPMPAFWLDMSHMATNHFLSGRRVPSIIVPAVTGNWREHLVHCHLCAWPCTLEQAEYLRGQDRRSLRDASPPGASSRMAPRRDICPGAPGACPCPRIPSCSARLHGPSPLLPPLFRMHHHFILIVQLGADRNCWGYAGSPKPLIEN